MFRSDRYLGSALVVEKFWGSPCDDLHDLRRGNGLSVENDKRIIEQEYRWVAQMISHRISWTLVSLR